MSGVRAIRPPDGCRWCGRGSRDHGIEWHGAVGYHGYIDPTDDQRIQRMRDRRGSRPGSPQLAAERTR